MATKNIVTFFIYILLIFCAVPGKVKPDRLLHRGDVPSYDFVKQNTQTMHGDSDEKMLKMIKQRKLWIVGIYIAAHKYFGIDFRYQTGVDDTSDRHFYKKFPSPTLRGLDKRLDSVCQDVEACLEEIYKVALKSGTMQYLVGDNDIKPKRPKLMEPPLPLYAPFDNTYDMFKFRQTAMYYLCWHVMFGTTKLVLDLYDVTCLYGLSMVAELPKGERKRLYKERKLPITDLRDIDRAPGFDCPTMWFCSDPCYGREDGGNFRRRDFRVKGNPCKDLKNGECKIMYKENQNFDDLIRNKWNITCDCQSEWQGFEWNSRFGMCIDSDECLTKTHQCEPNRICRNSVGAYLCTCPKGYEVDSKTGECERSSALHEKAVILEHNPQIQSQMAALMAQRKALEEDSGIISDLMGLVGLNAGTSLLSHTFSIWLAPLVFLFG